MLQQALQQQHHHQLQLLTADALCCHRHHATNTSTTSFPVEGNPCSNSHHCNALSNNCATSAVTTQHATPFGVYKNHTGPLTGLHCQHGSTLCVMQEPAACISLCGKCACCEQQWLHLAPRAIKACAVAICTPQPHAAKAFNGWWC
jgi:hypothetical protein